MLFINKMKPFVIVIIIGLMFTVCGCTKKPDEHAAGKIEVVTTLFPLFDFAKNVGGDIVRVSLLVPPGVEVHSFEPKPGDILKIKKADLFIYTGDVMEPWVQRVLSGIASERLRIVDVSKGIVLTEIAHHHENENDGHHHGKLDPHIWLDFGNAQKMVDTIAASLISKDPAHKETYLKNASLYKTKLDDLDRTYRQTLATCKKRVIIHGGHFAFNYLAKRNGIEYESAYPGTPDAEPTTRRVIELKKKLKEHGLDTVFYEELIEPRMADVLAKETGSKMLKLHGAHNITKEEMDQGVTFIQLMEQNLTSLKTGLQCQGN